MGWIRMNKLKLNSDKTEVLLIDITWRPGNGILLVLGRVILSLKSQVCNLGGLLDLVSSLANPVFYNLRLIQQLLPGCGRSISGCSCPDHLQTRLL